MYKQLSVLRYNFYNSNILYGVRIFIALAGTTYIPWLIKQTHLTIPLTLGMVAAALTDLDNRFARRLQNVLLTLICFFIVSISIELLMPYPILFVFGLAISTFSFIMLGCLGQRYATIAFGSLLISIYTMLGYGVYQPWYMQPILLISGAFWYNIITLLGHLLFPIRPIQDQVSLCYKQLATYLETKAMLFDPDEEGNFDKQLITLSTVNRNLIAQLNQTKSSLLTRLKAHRSQRDLRHYLHYYFIVQDIHEQTNSIHIKYQILSNTFRYSDMLFRFQRLLTAQADACREIAKSITYHEKYHHSTKFNRMLTYLHDTLSIEKRKSTAAPDLLHALNYLLDNLQQLDRKFVSIESEQFVLVSENHDEQLADDNTISLPFWQFVKQQFTLNSSLFRHALRMTIVLVIGYGIIQFAQLKYGYWILLTSLFVCQPNYYTTKHRLLLRVIGTFGGIIVGLPILYLITTQEVILLLIILSGWLFFIFRNNHYAYATLFITLLVLFCFNLLGNHTNIIIPRIFDTLVGCIISWLAVNYIWPDWKFCHLQDIVNKTLVNNVAYLNAITTQYHYGKNNSVEYRLARRNAYNSDAELSSVITSMSAEPKKKQQSIAMSFKWLYLNQLILGYISALGAHRQKLHNAEIVAMLTEIQFIFLKLLEKNISNQTIDELIIYLEQKATNKILESSNIEQFIIQQIIAILNLLPELIILKKKHKDNGSYNI